MNKNSHAFTIVELLIVIVVIAILASISVVAYTGIQDRARSGVLQSDLRAINTAIQLYHADHGVYPEIVGPDDGNNGTRTTLVANSGSRLRIGGLVPEYMSQVPKTPADSRGTYYAYIRANDGQRYKLLRLIPVRPGVTLPSHEQKYPNLDPVRRETSPSRGWGYWSDDYARDNF